MTQTAYQLVAERSSVTVWDTGRVELPSMALAYAGEKLGSRDAVTWRVRLWGGVRIASRELLIASCRLPARAIPDWSEGYSVAGEVGAVFVPWPPCGLRPLRTCCWRFERQRRL